MAWTCTASTHLILLKNLQSANLLSHPSAFTALTHVDRAFFVPSTYQPYSDSPQPLPHAATISAPHMHAIALSALAPFSKPGCSALDIGTGSGLFAAALAMLTGSSGHVIALEHVPALSQLAQQNISNWRASLPTSAPIPASITVRPSDGRQGAPSDGPFLLIHVGAAAENVPKALLDQLAPGGAMVIPVASSIGAQSLQLIHRSMEGVISINDICPVRYVPLCDLDNQLTQ